MVQAHAIIYSLVPAVHDDASDLVELKVDALEESTLSAFLFKPSVYREGRRREAWSSYWSWRIGIAFSNPNAQIINAVDDATGTILGYATWTFMNGDELELQPPGTTSHAAPSLVLRRRLRQWRHHLHRMST